MIITDIDEASDISSLCNLYNKFAEDELVYKKISEEFFRDVFMTTVADLTKIMLVAIENGKQVGFGAGCVTKNGGCYITFLLIDTESRSKGVGKALLKELEQKFKTEHSASTCIMSFRNPCRLPWIIPMEGKKEHMNAPGVDMASRGYLFFKNQGYSDVTYENCYYRSLDDFIMPEGVAEDIKKLEQDDIFICDADKNVHIGFGRLFDNLNNEEWRTTIISELEKQSGSKVIIARKGIHPIGFAGPISLAKDKRGIFCGIGVDTNYREKGIGKSLFYSLCNAFHQDGATYITLFTNSDGNAAPIYHKAGLRIVKIWATMSRKI